ncbi:MAG: hypothetical protein ACKOWD_06035 [Rhodoferax sp.]
MKTELGRTAFNARSDLFSSRQRRVFIVADGNKSVIDILAVLAPLGVNQADLEDLLEKGFLTVLGVSEDPALLPVQPKAPPKMTEKERYLLAKPLATQLTASLGILGLRLNLAVESASGTEDLLALLPRIQAAAGKQKCRELERVLKG